MFAGEKVGFMAFGHLFWRNRVWSTNQDTRLFALVNHLDFQTFHDDSGGLGES